MHYMRTEICRINLSNPVACMRECEVRIRPNNSDKNSYMQIITVQRKRLPIIS